MTPTGFDNVIYSNSLPSLALKRFNAFVELKWPLFIGKELFLNEIANLEKGETSFEFFFCKNKRMSTSHDRNGYCPDAKGEGCFLVIVRFIKHYSAEILVETERSADAISKDAYRAILKVDNLYEYTVVTPAPPSENTFSKYLIDSLVTSLDSLDHL